MLLVLESFRIYPGIASINFLRRGAIAVSDHDQNDKFTCFLSYVLSAYMQTLQNVLSAYVHIK